MTTTDGPAPQTETESLAEWLSSRADADLVEMLRLRPDLSVPLPGSMQVLAARAEQRASVLRAADELNALSLAVIEVLALEGAAVQAVPEQRLHDVLADRAPVKQVAGALEHLRSRALVWGSHRLRVLAAAVDAVPWQIGRSLEPIRTRSEAEIEQALAAIGPTERSLLDRLANSAPIGRTRDAAPGTPADRPVQRLLSVELLDWIDDQTVELPHQVGQVLRGEPVTDPGALTPPPARPVEHPLAEVNGAAAGEALELLRHCEAVLEALGESPAPMLRAGGMGVRELRRIAKRVDVEEDRVSLLVELLAAAGLLGSGRPDPAPPSDPTDEFWAPTAAADGWLDAPAARRWTALAGGWLELPRRPWLAGMRDANDKPIAALSEEARSAVAPRDRRLILELLSDLRTGESADAGTLARILAWRRPRLAGRFGHHAVAKTLDEATALGIVGRGALSSPGRALLHGGDAEAEMESALPDPVDYVLVQADLTVVAPGPLTADLQGRVALVADVESAGGATVYRIGETSVRRALDAGSTAAELHELFATHSRTPVPQSLTYLIDDVARRHGRLRVGMAESFIRCDDPALLAEVLRSPAGERLAMRALAPTVAISQAPLADVLEQLRAAGFAPAGEDSAGVIVDVRQRGARILGRRTRRHVRTPPAPNTEQLENLVRELRANERAATTRHESSVRTDGTRASAAATTALLQLAVRVGRSVRIDYVDAQGTATHRIVEPTRVGGGQLDAVDSATGSIRHFTLHRIASVALVE